MKLNINFDPALEEIINLYAPLADWFERNQETMAYFEMTHKGCLHFNKFANPDVVALGKMADAALTWLEYPKTALVTSEVKVVNAALSIARVYEEEKEKLSEEAKSLYYIDIQALQKDDTEEDTMHR